MSKNKEKYKVMVQQSPSNPGSWVKGFEGDFNTCQWWASTQSEPTQVVPA